MSYYQSVDYGTRLPVSPEQPDNRCGANSTPIIRVDLGAMSEFLPVLVDSLVLEIQNQVGKNAMRTFAFNLWGQNGYQNQLFIELLGVFAMHCEGRILMNRREDPVRIIQAEAPFFMNAAMGMLVQQYPDLTGYLPPDAEPVVDAAKRDWAQLTRDLRAVQAQYSNQSYGPNQGYNQNYNQGYQRGAPMQGGMGFNGNRGQNVASQNRGDPRPIWEQDQLPQGTRQGAAVGNNGFNRAYAAAAPERPYQPSQRTVVVPEAQSDFRPVSTQPATARFDERPRIITPAQKADVQVQSSARASSPASQRADKGTTMTKHPFGTRQYDRVPLQDGTELYAAVTSPHKVKWTPERPPLAFDREEYILFHRFNPDAGPGQTVLQETIQRRTDDMEYLDHELDESLKRIYRQQGDLRRPSGPADVATIKRMVPLESGRVGTLVSAERLKALDEAKAPRVITKAIIADGIDGSMAEAHLEVLRQGGDGKTMEYVLKSCREQCLDKGAYSAVLDFKRSATYEELLDKLVTFALENPDSDLTDICNERLTRVFNRFLQKSMYFSWSIDSLLEDYMDAREKIASSSGEQLQDQFAKSVRYVIDQALSMLEEDELDRWFERHLPIDATDTFEEPVVFVDPMTVTTVPWSMYELEKRFRLEGLVTRDMAGELYEALEAIFLRTTDPSLPSDAQTKLKLREHVIVTNDGKKLYARASYLSPGLEHFAVTLEPPVIIPPREARA